MSAPELVGERVRLRGWRGEDLEPYLELMADPEVAYWLGNVLTPELIRDRFPRMGEALEERGWGSWAVVSHDGELLGSVGLAPVPVESGLPMAPAIEAAWRLKRSAWGHGYASEAMRLVLDHADTVPELAGKELVAFTAASNLRSQAVMRRLGFEHDPSGDFDHPILAEGHPLRRHVLYRRSPTAVGAIKTSLAVTDSADQVVLYVPDRTTYRLQNIARIRPDGSQVWLAQLPPETGPDCYVGMSRREGRLEAGSWSCFIVVLDEETGQILNSTFHK